MEIKRVSLTNFKKHHKLEFNIEPGITGIVGMNGVGKSSMLEGIYFGITGQALGDESRSDLLNWDSKDGKVELLFNVDGKDFVLTRSINKNTATLEGFENKIVGIKGVNEAMADLMKVNPDYLKDILFVAQEQIDSPLRGTEAARKEAFGKLFGCTKLEKLRDIILAQNNALPFDKTVSDAVIEDAYAKVSERLDKFDAFKEAISNLKNEIATLPKLDDLIYKSRLRKKSDLVNILATLTNQKNQYQQEIDTLNIDATDSDENKLREEYLNLNTQFKMATSSVCPTCGTVLKECNIDPNVIKQQMMICKQKIDKLVRKKQLDDLLNRVNIEIEKVNSNNLVIDDEEHALVLRQLQERNTKETTLVEWEKAVAVEKTLIDQAIADIEQMTIKNDRNKMLQAVSDRLEFIRIGLHRDNAQQYIRAQGAAQINERLKEIVSVFNIPHEVYFTEDGLMKFRDVESKTEHNFSSMSGGQKKLVALAYRLSLMRLFVSGINICVLDEPTAFIDKDNIDAMKEAFLSLNTFAKNKGLAIFIATHEERLYTIFNNIIEV